MGKLSVGPPYFDAVFVPLMTPALFLMGVGTLAKWKKAELPDLARRLRWAAIVAGITAIAVPLAMGRWSPMLGLGMLLAGWIAAAMITDVIDRVGQLAAVHGGGIGHAIRALPRGYWGMQLAHLGVAVFVVGIGLVKGFEVEKDLKMRAGDIAEVGGYGFRLEGFEPVEGPNYDATRGIVTVLEHGKERLKLYPEKRIYGSQSMPMTEADMHSSFTRDLYVSLGEAVGDDAWIVRVYVKPFIDWIWGGCALMALGGLLAMTDRRYRLARREATRNTTATQVATA